MTGGFLVLARVLRLGMLGDFLSGSALIGLFTGIGIQVASGQIPEILGVKATGSTWLEQQWGWITAIPSLSWATFAFGVVTIAIIALVKLFAPRLPGSLIAVVGLLIVSMVLNASSHGVSVIGKVTGGLPALSLPAGVTWADAIAVTPVALACTLLVIAQSAATLRKVAMAHGERADVNRDLVGLSAANIAAAFSGTFVVNGSPTKTQVLEQARGRTQVANLVVVAATVLVLTFLTGVLADHPHAVLAGVVFMIGVSLLDIRGLRTLAKRSRWEFVVACSTMFAAFLVSITAAIITAVALSLLDLILRQYRTPGDVLAPKAGGGYEYQPLQPGVHSEPGLIVFRYGGDLFFANANAFTDMVEDVVSTATDPVRWLIIDTSSISHIDYSASQNVIDLLHYLDQRGIHVAFARPTPMMMATLRHYGLTKPLKDVQVFPDLDTAIAAFRADSPAPTAVDAAAPSTSPTATGGTTPPTTTDEQNGSS